MKLNHDRSKEEEMVKFHLYKNKKAIVVFSSSLILLTFLLYGCGTTGTDSSEDKNTKQEQENVVKEQRQEQTLEEYIPNETDVVFYHNALKNKDILEEFSKVAGENGEDNESQIRVVKYESKGPIIYDLKSRYDETADQAWIEVAPDLSYFIPSETETQDVFNNASQQCGYMSKDTVKGYYKLNECRTHWEYWLLPIVSDTLSNEELEDIYQTSEELDIKDGHYYYLEDPITEIFLSKKGAKEWQRYYEEGNQDKLEEATINNVTKGLMNNIDLDRITSNEVLVSSCQEGLCEVYTEHSHVFKAFVVPEVKINKESEMANTEDQSENKVNTDKELFWSKMRTQVDGILDHSNELTAIYENGETVTDNKDFAKLLYKKVNGRVNILRNTLVPEDEKTENRYNQILMATEFLFNSLHQGQLYIENKQEKELGVLVDEEIIPLRDELEELTTSTKEFQSVK